MCYYLLPVQRDLATPLVAGLPADVICQKLKKRDDAICKLEFGASLKTVRSVPTHGSKAVEQEPLKFLAGTFLPAYLRSHIYRLARSCC